MSEQKENQKVTDNVNNENTRPEEQAGTENMAGSEKETDENAGAEVESAEEKLKKELAELNDKYLRLYSEFDNFRRRTTKERVELLQSAGKEMIVALLPILDDFERAERSMKDSKDIEAVKEGINLVHHKLKNLLIQKGLKPIEAIGNAFDVDFHEAITNIPAPSEDLKGKVVDEMEKGYLLNEKVIRFAKVVVGE